MNAITRYSIYDMLSGPHESTIEQQRIAFSYAISTSIALLTT